MRSVELFSGIGGLALGIAKAGFHHEALVELDQAACETIRFNQVHGLPSVSQWPLFEGDVRDFHFEEISGEIDLLAGGPPCQPFSLAGRHRGEQDSRNMFPEAIRAVRALRPRVFMFENVKGLLRTSFAKYFEYILLQLTYPFIERQAQEPWPEHLSRLEKHHTGGTHHDGFYNVTFRCLNAADYGVPQRRERVIIVGFRSDLGIEWSFPNATHSLDALLWKQWVSGDYWDEHGISRARVPELPPALDDRIERLRMWLVTPPGKPWLTVREALSGLPDPREAALGTPANHVFVPGARSYAGHTGSHLDEPAKTLKAGDHGVPGGENMVVESDGRVRYFTVRESARLQTFPDDYAFPGSWTESMRQLGNAVPVALAETVASSIRSHLERGMST